MFYQNWKLSLIAIIMIPLASIAAKTLGKRIEKIVTQQMNKAGILTSYLIEIFKNHKLMKIFQRENFEKNRANQLINELKEKSQKIAVVHVRASPIMEFLTGIMIAFLIFISAKLVSNGELEVSNFFIFSSNDACLSASKVVSYTKHYYSPRFVWSEESFANY